MSKLLKDISRKIKENRLQKIASPYGKALDWVKRFSIPEEGIVVTSRQKVPYLEVTGYLIPTLVAAGEHRLALRYGEFLLDMQKPNGSFNGADGKEYIFDSGQVLRGLLALSSEGEQFAQAAQRCADYIVQCADENGRLPANYEYDVTEYVHLYVLPPLLQAATILNNSKYQETARRSVEFYKTKKDIFSSRYLTHFLGYILDGFMECGEEAFVRPFFEEFISSQRKDGSIPGKAGVPWVCSVGLAQLAIVGHKLKMVEMADQALQYLCHVQNPSGGFYGSYGRGASYFPKEEISWANKFFLDALHIQGTSFKNAEAKADLLNQDQWYEAMAEHSVDHLADRIRKNSYPVWSRQLLAHTVPGDAVVELGSGTGELAAILSAYGREVHLVDYSQKSIAYSRTLFDALGLKAQFSVIDILSGLPLETDSADWVFSSGVLEHFTDEEILRILKDSVRVCRKGVISFVPNSRCLFYRIGKSKQEREGTWAYGKEIPKASMKPYFQSASLTNIKEFSVGTYHALRFYGENQEDIRSHFDTLSCSELQDLNQGYLLFTYGEKHV